MANRTSSKRKSKTKVGSSSKAKDAKSKKKRGRKVAPPILRPTLPMKTPTGQNRGLKVYCTDINGKSTSMKRKLKKEVGESSKANMQKLKRKGVERFPLPFLDQHYPCECETYVAAFAEFLSDEMKVPSIPFRSDYLRSRYATLLWKYGTDKAKTEYDSENDNPTRLNVSSFH